jgi:hypothetical protein
MMAGESFTDKLNGLPGVKAIWTGSITVFFTMADQLSNRNPACRAVSLVLSLENGAITNKLDAWAAENLNEAKELFTFLAGFGTGVVLACFVPQSVPAAIVIVGAGIIATVVDYGAGHLYDYLKSHNVQFVKNLDDAVWFLSQQGKIAEPLKFSDPYSGQPSCGFDLSCWWNKARIAFRGFFQWLGVLQPDPLVLNLDGLGIQTVGVKSGAHFDHDCNGFAEATGWVAPGNGVLVMDRNGDGIINDGSELSGGNTLLRNGKRAENGFQALADLDSNNDGRIDAADPAFRELRVWTFDEQGTQLLTLDELGIKAINL